MSLSVQTNICLLTRDAASLPASFIVWACSPEADFLKGKLVWANWDVEELKARKEEIRETDFLTLGLSGWPSESALMQGEQSRSKGIFARIKRFLCL